MTRHSVARFLLLALFACTAWPEDCERGRALYDAAKAESDLARRVHLLSQSIAACDDPVAYGDLALAYLQLGEYEAARGSLEAAARYSAEPAQQVQIYALMARIYLTQDHLPEAIQAINLAFDRAIGPVPEWVRDLRREIDSHPGRGHLSVEEISRSLSLRSIPSRGFAAVPRLDLYVLFGFDQDEPTADGRAQVDALAQALAVRARVGNERYRVIGHTDEQGDAVYNQRLSERRAESVRRLIEEQSPILVGRLYAEGRGESEPKYRGGTEEDRRLNRRVEIQVLLAPPEATD